MTRRGRPTWVLSWGPDARHLVEVTLHQRRRDAVAALPEGAPCWALKRIGPQPDPWTHGGHRVVAASDPHTLAEARARCARLPLG